jgi:hypothetical protein
MNDKSIRDSLSHDDRAKFEHGAEVLAHLQKGGAFDQWVVIGQGLIPVRDAILRLFRLSRPRGRLYAETFSKACRQTPYAHLDSDERSNLLYCVDNLATIEKMRAEWSPAERASVCHPDTMRKRLREYAGDPKASNKEPRKSPMAVLKEQYVEATAKIARLQDVVDKGSTFSAKDTYGDLAQFLADRITDSRLSRDKALKMLKRTAEILKARWAREDAEFAPRKTDDRPEDRA